MNITMKRKILSLLFSALFFSSSFAQEIIPKPSGSVATAGILSIGGLDFLHSVNPSMNTYAKGFNLSVGYTLPYHLDDFQQIVAKGAYAFPWVTLHVNVNKCGGSESNITIVGGGLSKSFGILGIGMEYNAIMHQLPFNETTISSFSRVGFHINPNDKWTLSVAVHNIENRQLDYEYDSFNIEPCLFAGIRWIGNDIFSLIGEVEKGWNHKPVYKASALITPCKRLSTSVGFSTLGHSLSAGVGYVGKMLLLHVGISHHEQLGVTSSASIAIHNLFNNK